MTRQQFADDALETAGRFGDDIREFLNRVPRQLPSRYFYDGLGSALFDAICELPWYRITRAESRLLRSHAAEVHARLRRLTTVIELGPGNGEKLKLLLEGAGANADPLDVHLVDVSAKALQTATGTLDALPNVRLTAHIAEYDRALAEIAGTVSGGSTLVLFLGSNIGNFDPPCATSFLDYIREHLAEGDALLLGADLVKPEAELLLAYDDPLGVTAAFNRNLLVRINRELNANFDLEQFAHEAIWNPADSRVELHLVAQSAQHVRIANLPMELEFAAGERIWTESSHKYRPSDIAGMLEGAGFQTVTQWIDRADRFALTLARAV